jgi:adenosylcobinamide-phosphate synthase
MTLFLSLFSVVVVLLLEQLRPLPVKQVVLDPLRRVTAMLVKRLDTNRKHHEQLAWGLLVLGGTALCVLISYKSSLFFDVLFAILVLYLSMGFRHESHYFTDIHFALRAGETERARAVLGE